MMRTLPAGTDSGKDGGFVLLRSLLTMGAVLLCTAALCAALASVLMGAGRLESRIEDERAYRNERILERIR
jgi:uncharacterized membrane protein